MKQASSAVQRIAEDNGSLVARGRGHRRLGTWLVLVTALVSASSPAWGQKKKPKPAGGGGAHPAQPAGGAIDLDAPPQGAAPAGAAAPGGAVELDGPQTPPAGETPPAGDAPAGGGGGICDIDPSACPKQLDIKEAAKKEVAAEVYAVEQKYFLHTHRFELNPFWGFSLNDQFVSHPGPGLVLNYYLSDVIAVGLAGTFYGGLNVDSDFNFQNRRATRVATPLNQYLGAASANFTYVPVYGKFEGFREFIFNYDLYLLGGVGALWTKPIPVIDPDNRAFDYKAKIAFNVGGGLRIALNRWIAPTLEIRNFIYTEDVENVQVAATQAQQRDPSTWLQSSKPLTVHVQAQLGVSFFLPTSWDYKLPK